MPDWRLDQVQHLHGQKLVRLRYKRYSETWDHDHCSACNAKFFEQDGAGTQPEGYTTGPDYSKGREYEWVCVRCFDERKNGRGGGGRGAKKKKKKQKNKQTTH